MKSVKLISTLAIIAAISVTFPTMAISAYADDSSTRSDLVRWTNTQSIMLTLSFSNNTATAAGLILGQSSTTDSINASFSLSQKNSNGTFTTVQTWPAVKVKDFLLSFQNTAKVTAGKTYRINVTATVTNKSGVSETVTDYFENTNK